MNKNSYKIFGTICVLVYAFAALITSDPLGSIESSVSISVILYGLYAAFLWRYNLFEKTPYIGGTYDGHHWSSYANNPEYHSTITIKQTLFGLSLFEAGSSGWNSSVSASFMPTSGNGWTLVYTYLTHPSNNAQRSGTDMDDPHYGTMILFYHPDKPNHLEGTYFTNRLVPTCGHSELDRQK